MTEQTEQNTQKGESVATFKTNMTEEQRQQWASLVASGMASHELHNKIYDALEMILSEATSNKYVDEKFIKEHLEAIADEMDIEWPEDSDEG
jgi:hypothetical protein